LAKSLGFPRRRAAQHPVLGPHYERFNSGRSKIIRCEIKNRCLFTGLLYRKMFFRNRARGFRTTGFFRSYFILGILGLSIVFFLYSNWVTGRLKRETAEFSVMLAHFAAQFPSIEDKETSDAAGTIIDKFRIPFIVTDAAGQPIIARGIGNGLREKILANTLTPGERQKIAELIANMDRNHSPIPMKGVMAEEGRKIVGYIYYDETKWQLNQASSFVITNVAEEPVLSRNIDGVESSATERADTPRAKIQSFVEEAKEKGYFTTIQHNPPTERAYFHYGSTGLIHQLRWWVPLAQMIMVALFLIIGFLGYQRLKYNEQQAIWAGLAKETAHQLGTPISSLMGWLEILGQGAKGTSEEKDKAGRMPVPPDIYEEMRGDVLRLEDITARFGEVGSVPKREPLDVTETIHRAVVYFQRRLPHRQKHVEIIESHQNVPEVEANENLLQWVIENLIRNSLDAITRDDGRIQIRTEFDPKKRNVLIIYRDNGKGIPRKNRNRAFLPGYSSKKHGWGLGLAIVKRIIEGYHGGRVKIAESGSEGSTFVITLPAKSSNE
jgi:signal transduction histidine kinase